MTKRKVGKDGRPLAIKAKATIWNGIEFKSRLEARWAIFFTTLHITWKYEPKWVELPVPGQPSLFYKPDFYLPAFDLWVEVKPVRKLVAEERAKAFYFVRNGHANHLLVLQSELAPTDTGIPQAWLISANGNKQPNVLQVKLGYDRNKLILLNIKEWDKLSEQEIYTHNETILKAYERAKRETF